MAGTGLRLRAVNHGIWLLGLMVAGLSILWVASGATGLDSHAYYAAWHHHLYSAAPEQRDAYLYSPLFAELVWPATLLPWPLFCALWIAIVSAIYLWLLNPLPLKWRIPLLLACTNDIVAGNVWSIFALVYVFGFAYSATWAFPLLTKVTPGVGVVWFLTRREWRKLFVLGAVVLVAAGTSMAFGLDLWRDWIRLLLHPGAYRAHEGSFHPIFFPRTPILLAAEIPIAIGMLVYAARSEKRWLVPVAMVFANPMFSSNALLVLAAIPRLRKQSETSHVTAASPVPTTATSSREIVSVPA
jgi:hypothetical protein